MCLLLPRRVHNRPPVRLRSAGEFEAATTAYEEALRVYRLCYGDAHGSTLTAMQNLAYVSVLALSVVADCLWETALHTRFKFAPLGSLSKPCDLNIENGFPRTDGLVYFFSECTAVGHSPPAQLAISWESQFARFCMAKCDPALQASSGGSRVHCHFSSRPSLWHCHAILAATAPVFPVSRPGTCADG